MQTNQLKKVILINQNSGYLTIDIANALLKKYDSVVLICGLLKPFERELDRNVKIQKIIKYRRNNIFWRILTWGIGSLQIFFLLKFRFSNHEIIYTTNPPMGYLSSLFVKNRFMVVIYDLYPDSLKSIGLTGKHFLVRWWTNWNRKVFMKAEKVIAIGNYMAESMNHYNVGDKIEVISNWYGSEKLVPIEKHKNPFVMEHDLDEKFVVIYSGNIGFTHNVDTLIEVAHILKDNDSIIFLIIGEGGRKEKLIQKSRQYKLSNCIFMTWQPSQVLPFSLASGDLSVITINEKNADASLPSKTFNALAVGSPLLCITPDNSELSYMVKKYKNGACFSKEKISEIAEFVLSLSKDREFHKSLSENSLEAAKNFTHANAEKYL